MKTMMSAELLLRREHCAMTTTLVQGIAAHRTPYLRLVLIFGMGAALQAVESTAEDSAVNVPMRYIAHTLNVTCGGVTVSGINDNAQVTGVCSERFGQPRGYLYRDNSFVMIDFPGAFGTEPSSINNSGYVVGKYWGDGQTHGFVFREGAFTTFDVPGAVDTTACCINDVGQVAGSYQVARADSARAVGFLYSNGTFTTLDLPAYTDICPSGINASGQVIGYATKASSYNHCVNPGRDVDGFIYSGGAFTILRMPEAKGTVPTGVNAQGQVTGYYVSPDSSDSEHGFLYLDGAFSAIDQPGGGTHPAAINNQGQVVTQSGYVYSAGVWTRMDPPPNDDFYGGAPGRFRATSINNGGQVAGSFGIDMRYGPIHAFIAEPLWQPSSVESWPLREGDRTLIGDFDGDGTAEIFTHNGRVAGIVRYYSDTGLRTENVTHEAIGDWQLSPDDKTYVGDFDGDGKQEIFIRSARYAGILRYDPFKLISQLVTYDWIDGWQLNPGDKSYVGDFDGDGKDEVFVQSWGYAGLLRYNGTSWTSEAVVVGAVGDWPLNINDLSYVGDFDGDGRDEIFMRKADTAGVIRYDGAQLTGSPVGFDWIGGWHLGVSDRSYIGHFNSVSRDQIFVISNRYAGILDSSDGQWTSETVIEGAVGDWHLDAQDVATVTRFSRYIVDGIFIRSTSYAGVLGNVEGAILSSRTVVAGAVGDWKLGSRDESYAGDFMRDGLDRRGEIFVRSANYAGLLKYDYDDSLISLTVVGENVPSITESP